MLRRPAAALAVLLLASACARKFTPEQRQARLQSADRSIAVFREKLTRYPPVFAGGAEERRRTEQDMKQALADLRELEKADPKDAETEWRLGELHRLANLLDFKDSWKEARSHLQRAAELKPDWPQPHVTLGLLYVNTSIDWAGDAEKEFKKALELAGGQPLPTAHSGLFFVYLHQNRLKEALAEADRYLALSPASADFKKARDAVERQLKTESRRKPR